MLGTVVEQAVCCLQDRLGKLAQLMSRTKKGSLRVLGIGEVCPANTHFIN